MKGMHKKSNGRRIKINTGFSPTYRKSVGTGSNGFEFDPLLATEIPAFYVSKHAKGRQTNKKKSRKK
jgi:hypothetical protein